MKNNFVERKFTQWVEKEEKFLELILTPDGNLYFDEELESCADWFMLYQDGRICIRPSGNLYCLGALPCSGEKLPICIGGFVISSVNDDACVLISGFPDLDFEGSAFAVFQYGEMIGSYTADTTYSDQILFRMSANTPRNKDGAIKVFFTQLNHYNPKLCKKIEAWLKGHGVSWKGE